LALQGATFVAHRTDGALQQRAKDVGQILVFVLMGSFSLAGVFIVGMDGYTVSAMGDVNQTLNPLMKEVTRTPGGWLSNFMAYPALWFVPALAYVGALGALLSLRMGMTILGFVGSSLACVSVILTAGVALFPFVLPSSEAPNVSLTLWDSASSHYTLNVMFWVALIFTPIVLSYTAWAYRVMAGKVTRDYVAANDKSLY
jgi:cytochrome d ubiquinol oxidase subunit II